MMSLRQMSSTFGGERNAENYAYGKMSEMITKHVVWEEGIFLTIDKLLMVNPCFIRKTAVSKSILCPYFDWKQKPGLYFCLAEI